MKRLRIVLFAVLLSAQAEAAITQAQIDQAKLTATQMRDTLDQMLLFIGTVRPIIDNGNSFQLSFSTNTAALTASQQADIIAQYNSLKASLVAEFATFP